MREKQGEGIWERLCRKRILLLGPESDMKQKFLQAFRNRKSEISEDAETMSSKDCVILFGFADRSSSAKKNAAGKDPAGQAFGTEDTAGGWELFASLTGILRRIEKVRPASVLFVSRSDVYGKLFGEFHPVRESDLGYVCHTNRQDQEAARLRMLENLCFRMAWEDGIAVKIARFPDEGCQDWERTAEQSAKVLLDGTAGEAYNIEGSVRQPSAYETTALEPIKIVMDTGKAGKLE